MTEKQPAEAAWGAPQPGREKPHGSELLYATGAVDGTPSRENEAGESLAEQLRARSTALLRRLSQRPSERLHTWASGVSGHPGYKKLIKKDKIVGSHPTPSPLPHPKSHRSLVKWCLPGTVAPLATA